MSRTPGWAADPPEAKIVGALALGAASVAAVTLLGDLLVEPGKPEAQALHGSAALLATSVLADSAVEHYRGGFENPGMYTPLVVSALTLAAGIDGMAAQRLPRRVRDGLYGLASGVGAGGVAFHVYNVLRRPGGLSWLNLFYAAPLGAPAALTMAGAIGLAADEVASTPRPERLGWFGVGVGRALSALSAVGLFGAVGEAGLMHFRGSFQNPSMWAPVSLPPVAAALMAKAALEPARERTRPLTRAWLGLTAVLGLAGVGFHAFGVSRAMGGWRNWSQNLIDGPPLPAPPSFSALAIAALAALNLRDREDA
jgi:hypothetical protein